MRFVSRPSLTLWLSTASAFRATPSYFTTKTPLGSYKTALRMSSTETSNKKARRSSFRVALCQFHVTPKKDENHNTAKEYLSKAKESGADLVVLPEIWNSPYATAAFPEYAETLPCIGDTDSNSPSSKILFDAAKEHKMWIVGGSIPEKVLDEDSGSEKIYNTCLVLNPDGEVVAKHRKVITSTVGTYSTKFESWILSFFFAHFCTF